MGSDHLKAGRDLLAPRGTCEVLLPVERREFVRETPDMVLTLLVTVLHAHAVGLRDMPLTHGVDDGDDRFGCSAWRHYSDAVAVNESALRRVGLADLQGTFASPSQRRAWRLRFLGIVTRPSDLSVTTPRPYPSS